MSRYLAQAGQESSCLLRFEKCGLRSIAALLIQLNVCTGRRFTAKRARETGWPQYPLWGRSRLLHIGVPGLTAGTTRNPNSGNGFAAYSAASSRSKTADAAQGMRKSPGQWSRTPDEGPDRKS